MTCVATAVMLASALSAFDAPVQLQWSAPPACPDRDEVAARAERMLLASDAEPVARGEIVAWDDGSFELLLSIERASGTIVHRERARGCDELADLAALWIAVAADPVATAVTTLVPEPEVAPSRVPLTLDVGARAESSPRPQPPRARPALAGWLRASGLVGVALLPGQDAGVGLGGALAIDRWRIELGAAYLFSRTRGVPGFAPAQAVMSAWLASVRGCGELGPLRVRIGACVGTELGAVVAEARRVTTPNPEAGLWVAATLGPVLRWRPTGRLQVHLGLDAVLGLARPTFALANDPGRSFAAGAGGLRATLGLAVGLGAAEIVRGRRRR